MRSYYADRFDVRENLVDWDYHMALKDAVIVLAPCCLKPARVRSNTLCVGTDYCHAMFTGFDHLSQTLSAMA